jgi:hypothetical protein
MVGPSHEINEGDGGTDGEPSMPRLQAPMLAVAAVARSIQATKLCQILRKRREVSQD